MRLVLGIPGTFSLKDKRSVVSRVRDRVRNRFPVSIAEVDALDEWDRAVFGISMVSNDARHIESTLDKVVDFVEELHVAEVLDDWKEIEAWS
ncbi:MAG: DUF503 domain-containing protein [Myxococcota bacterium]|nr:DUF503 domain-containing protein [Myxococcota bacterium]